MKYHLSVQEKLPLQVAPLVGAWIEIMEKKQEKNNIHVAPLVGAWIEISVLINLLCHCPRRSSCRSVD